MNAYLGPALLLGALSSAHCVGMCGPIALAVPSARSSHLGRMTDALLLNGGRLVTYAVIGALFGVFGRGLHLAGLQQALSISVGVLMVLAVLVPALFRKDVFTTATLGGLGRLRSMLARNLRRTSPEGLFLTGLMNGLLPCGMVYFAVAGALVQDGPLNGALFMLAFGLGTVPALLTLRLGAGMLTPERRSGLRRLAPYVLGLLGVLFIVRGLGLGIPYLSPALQDIPVGQQECH
jgi:sulfite exporter TauE/SafE